jgi:hypothetical protein
MRKYVKEKLAQTERAAMSVIQAKSGSNQINWSRVSGESLDRGKNGSPEGR